MSTTNASVESAQSDERSLLGAMLHHVWSTLLWLWSTATAHLSTPLLLLFVVPVATFVFVYLSAVFLYLHDGHKRRALFRIGEAVLHEHDLAKAGRELIAAFWDLHVSTGIVIGVFTKYDASFNSLKRIHFKTYLCEIRLVSAVASSM